MRFKLSNEDWDRLHDLSKSARTAPVILVGGVDLSASAHQRVQDFWRELAARYGFQRMTVSADYPETKEIEAKPSEATTQEQPS